MAAGCGMAEGSWQRREGAGAGHRHQRGGLGSTGAGHGGAMTTLALEVGRALEGARFVCVLGLLFHGTHMSAGEKIAGGGMEVVFTTGKGRRVLSMFFSCRDRD